MFGLTIGNPGLTQIESISEPVVHEDEKIYTVTFTDGKSIDISCPLDLTITDISKTISVGLNDVYQVTYSDDTTTLFEVVSGKHTYDDFGLVCTKYYIPEPKVKEQKIDIPFASGSVDLTEATGEIPFADREGLSFEFVIKSHDYTDWDTVIQNVAMAIHGQKMMMVSDNDTDHYYIVRLSVDFDKSYKYWGTITLTGSAEPFKYSILSSNEPWLWDPFNFINGQIISTADVLVDGTATVVIPEGGVKTSPSFIVTQASPDLGVVYNTNPPRTLPMTATGTYRFPQIKAGGQQATTITLVGHGRVSVDRKSVV